MPMPYTLSITRREDNKPRDVEFLKTTALSLLNYCRGNNWAGYDPYDALNSRLIAALPVLNFRISRLLITQLIKRSPLNLRPLLLVPRTHNPKGTALFLASIVRLVKVGLIAEDGSINRLAEMLLNLRSPGQRYFSWGYDFNWQTRGALVPSRSPNIICTSFAANALLDAYEFSSNPLWLDAAKSAADFVHDVLFWSNASVPGCFSYTPLERNAVHNANLLGAALCCRVAHMTGNQRYYEPAFEASRFSTSKQRNDGAWVYGESPHQKWIDNFHTGYNLTALGAIGKYGKTGEFDESVRRGLAFYLAHFFREDGAPKYYHDAVYPIDIHSVAISMIVLTEFAGIITSASPTANSIFRWAVKNMWDPEGYFYYQKRRSYTVRTPFMRWSQAWMLLALSTLWGSIEGYQREQRRFP